MSVLHTGAAIGEARTAGLLLHGRGAYAGDMIGLAGALQRPDIAWLAPQAPGFTWYPQPFLMPQPANEPYLSDALAAVTTLVTELEGAGIARSRIVLGGFSQGACLALEYAARHGGRWGAVLGFSGGLIGDTIPRDRYAADLFGTPVLLGCSDRDPHIPRSRVEETAQLLETTGARVDLRLYADLGHAINEDELEAARVLLDPLARLG